MKDLYNQLQAATDPLETIEISDKILNERLRRYIMHMFLKGESLLSLAKFDDALSVFTQILEYDDERFNGRAHNSIGFCYSMQNKPRKAESEFKKAHEYPDKSSLLLNSTILNIATYYSQTNQKEDTYKIFKELYDLDPSNGYNDSYILLLTMSNNPEEFIAKTTRLIKEQKATMIVDHISYDQLEGTYDSDIFTAEKHASLDKAFKAEKHIQPYVFTDGTADKSVERKFAEELDGASEVCVYAKLPKGFSIPTPVGNYSPDWAIAFNEGTVKHIYFVAETKGTMESLQLRPIEKAKISCARKLFNEISTDNVVYHDVDSYQSLLNIMPTIEKKVVNS